MLLSLPPVGFGKVEHRQCVHGRKIEILHSRDNKLEFPQNNQILVVLTELDLWPPGLTMAVKVNLRAQMELECVMRVRVRVVRRRTAAPPLVTTVVSDKNFCFLVITVN